MKITTTLLLFFTFQLFFVQTVENDTIKVATVTTVKTISDTIKVAASPTLISDKQNEDTKS
ncbi:hypothetical protein [Flavobacterium caseinilyticum]|uniref:Uncharacterized protein n=1 Tax=Flavobacterium caseinilyticum TaxID=2541732 RepID=A0A4R5AVX1_9FLAO|nr:hypothetical protein [Flavobacterium caseinilyticum]TDD77558.1 hypothetical protein E0F89_08230 [Flavobacterium caseinilyticum]